MVEPQRCGQPVPLAFYRPKNSLEEIAALKQTKAVFIIFVDRNNVELTATP